jgi:hypothetical protein
MRTYDFNRGLATLLGAAIAGGLIYVAGTYIDDKTTGGYWAVYGIIAGAGLVMALSQLVGGWTKFGLPRLSVGTFVLGFLPVLVVVGWVACAMQPHGNTVRSHVLTWSSALAINHVVDHLGEYIAVLSFGLGLVLGFCGDTVGVTRRDEAYAGRRVAPAPATAPAPAYDRRAADEPLSAERTAVGTPAPAEDGLVGAGHRRTVEIREGGAPMAPRPDPEQMD